MTVLMHLLHHNTTANITIATQSPYLALVSSDAKPHNKSAANNNNNNNNNNNSFMMCTPKDWWYPVPTALN